VHVVLEVIGARIIDDTAEIWYIKASTCNRGRNHESPHFILIARNGVVPIDLLFATVQTQTRVTGAHEILEKALAPGLGVSEY
jgi:hypothetical protein